MIVHFLLLVRDVDGDEIGILDVTHFDLLLLEGVPCLVLAMVKSSIYLLATTLYLLAHTVVFAFCFA